MNVEQLLIRFGFNYSFIAEWKRAMHCDGLMRYARFWRYIPVNIRHGNFYPSRKSLKTSVDKIANQYGLIGLIHRWLAIVNKPSFATIQKRSVDYRRPSRL